MKLTLTYTSHIFTLLQGGKAEEGNNSSSESEDEEDNDSSSESEEEESSESTEDDGLSEYERLREQRIQRNQNQLRTLGFDKPKEEEKKKKKHRGRKQKTTSQDPQPQRRKSSRALALSYKDKRVVIKSGGESLPGKVGEYNPTDETFIIIFDDNNKSAMHSGKVKIDELLKSFVDVDKVCVSYMCVLQANMLLCISTSHPSHIIIILLGEINPSHRSSLHFWTWGCQV